jgi:hypothetical protein
MSRAKRPAEYYREWRAKNPDKVRASNQRQYRRRKAGGHT